MRLAIAILFVGFSGCSSMYYNTMEKVGIHKRDIMVDRVKEARDSQHEAKETITNALDQFRSIVKFQGGNLESQYNKLNRILEHSEARADEVHERIAAVEDVSDALFREWKSELRQYSSKALRRSSEQKYNETRDKYENMIAAMKNAESKIAPVLEPLKDQVLYLKHNLNARAIAALSDELLSVQTNVDALIRDMEAAIAEADTFIAALSTE
ncbi:MAG TPA: DUF2959 domain-containing protein [Verrucomicrobia bacterium]|nr:DUF2959 domain-containing protein [Verrucomicrobiota bacterium]